MNAVPECPGEEGEHDEEEEDESDGRGGGHGRHDRPGFPPVRSAAAASSVAPTAAVPVPCDYLPWRHGVVAVFVGFPLGLNLTLFELSCGLI